MEYYVEAGGVRSSTYKLNVIDLPSVKNLKVTYHYPAWTELKDFVENPGGDLRAVEGTTAEVAVETDRPLTTGAILLDDGTKLPLRQGAGGLVAMVPITKEGMYHVAAVEGGDDVRLSEDYFIEAQKYEPPEVKITRPGRDFKATPIEEVAVAVEAKDDFALKSVELHYSVNGAPGEMVILLTAQYRRQGSHRHRNSRDGRFQSGPGRCGEHLCHREGCPQDDVHRYVLHRNAAVREELYAGAGNRGRSAAGGRRRTAESTDFGAAEGNYHRYVEPGRGPRRQGYRTGERGLPLAGVQSKLRDQAKSLSDRMKARQLESAGDSFKSFVDDMDQAVAAMEPASNELKGAKWDAALIPEQKALQFLLRAEATMRDIQVTFGQKGGGGGGGGGGATRDLQGLFDLELDTEKNQ